jgi:hypothetical protein
MSNVRPQRTPLSGTSLQAVRVGGKARLLKCSLLESRVHPRAVSHRHSANAKALVLMRARTRARTARLQRSTGALGLLGAVVTYAAPPSSTAASLLQVFAAACRLCPRAPAGGSPSLFTAVPAVTVAHGSHPGHAVA